MVFPAHDAEPNSTPSAIRTPTQLRSNLAPERLKKHRGLVLPAEVHRDWLVAECPVLDVRGLDTIDAGRARRDIL
jgi:hypothetical protein